MLALTPLAKSPHLKIANKMQSSDPQFIKTKKALVPDRNKELLVIRYSQVNLDDELYSFEHKNKLNYTDEIDRGKKNSLLIKNKSTSL